MEACENEIPWYVAMLRKNNGWHGCGPAPLSCDQIIVVIAAHCIDFFLLFFLDSDLKFCCSSTKAKEIRLGFGAHVLAGGYPSPLYELEVRTNIQIYSNIF